jgi:23S rRNA pseudouridine1911/1915/1917 synthase
MVRFEPDPDEIGDRVDVVLARRTGATRTRVQRALRDGHVTVAGANVRPSHRLEAGQVVAGEVPEPAVAKPEPEDTPVEIRYSDARVLVVSKPAGVVVHPARGHEAGTLVNALLGLGGPLAKSESTRPGIVHRLDMGTSGLVLVARDEGAQAALVDALRRRQIERRYIALVAGRPRARSGTVDAPIGRHPVRRRHMAVTSGGRPAVTHYQVLEDTSDAALLDVKLETGRTHQIRVHMAHLGHPVVGDSVYGARPELARLLGLERPFLHARRLAFPHPDDGRVITVTDDLPADLMAALARAGLAVP